METENNLWLFSISITHNSKIRELSDGNRVMEIELLFGQTTILLWVPPFLSYELWKLRIELSNLVGQTASKSPIFMGLKFLKLELHCKLEFYKLEFQKSDIFIYISKMVVYFYIFCQIVVFGHFNSLSPTILLIS